MVELSEIENRIRVIPGVSRVEAKGDGYHYELVVVSDLFLDQPRVKRQQWVYEQLNDLILSGQLHALTMKTWTVEEWEKHNG